MTFEHQENVTDMLLLTALPLVVVSFPKCI